MREKRLAEFLDERTDLVEDSNGNLIMLDLAFMSRKGRWYVDRIDPSSKTDEIQERLGVKF